MTTQNHEQAPAGGASSDNQPQIINMRSDGMDLDEIKNHAEAVFNGISALATLLKISDLDRLHRTDHDGFLESFGYLVEMLADQSFKTFNEISFLTVSK